METSDRVFVSLFFIFLGFGIGTVMNDVKELNKKLSERPRIIVSPDMQTAVNYAQEGEIIYLLPGHYKMEGPKILKENE